MMRVVTVSVGFLISFDTQGVFLFGSSLNDDYCIEVWHSEGLVVLR